MVEIILTTHARCRLSERKIDVHEAKQIVKTGNIVRIEDDGTIIKAAILRTGQKVIVVYRKVGNRIIVKTVYYENHI